MYIFKSAVFFSLLTGPYICLAGGHPASPKQTYPLPPNPEREENVADRENLYDYTLYNREQDNKDNNKQNQYYYYQSSDNSSKNGIRSKQYFNPRRDD